MPLISVENLVKSVENLQLACGNTVEYFRKTKGKNKNCKGHQASGIGYRAALSPSLPFSHQNSHSVAFRRIVANSAGGILSRFAKNKAHSPDRQFFPVARQEVPIEKIEGTSIFARSHRAIELTPRQ